MKLDNGGKKKQTPGGRTFILVGILVSQKLNAGSYVFLAGCALRSNLSHTFMLEEARTAID